MKKVLVIFLAVILASLTPAWAHRDNNPATNLVMQPGVTCTSTDYYSAGYDPNLAIANLDHLAYNEPFLVNQGFHSAAHGAGVPVILTITFPAPVTFDRLAWNSPGVSWTFDSVWSAYLDGNPIVSSKNCETGGLNSSPYKHFPVGPVPTGFQHEKVILGAPVTGTVLRLEFTPENKGGSYYWAVRDINVALGEVWPSMCVAPNTTYDFNGDCIVNLADFAVIAAHWLQVP
jgi:hypothetical protein